MRRRHGWKGAGVLLAALAMATALSACGSKDNQPAMTGNPGITTTTTVPTTTSTTVTSTTVPASTTTTA